MRRFTKEEDEFLLSNYLTIPMKRIAKLLGRADSVAGQRLKRLGYSVPKEVAERFATESRIKPGNIPPNKGRKQAEYMTKEAIGRTVATRFTKGNIPNNHQEVGSERITKDGYREVKIAEPNKWEALHRVEWRKVNGEIPKGMVLVFKGDKMNPHPGNCELITRSDNMKRNSCHNYPKEIANLIQLRGALNRQIRKKINEKQNTRPAGSSI